MRINQNTNDNHINFKMKLSPKLAEKIKTDIFNGSEKKFIQFHKNFQKIHTNTEPSTVIDVFSKDGKTARLVYSSDLFPDVKIADMEHSLGENEMKNLHIYLLNLCTECTANNEMKLFFKGIKEELEKFTPVSKIKKIADNFKANAAHKKSDFEKFLDKALWESQHNDQRYNYF